MPDIPSGTRTGSLKAGTAKEAPENGTPAAGQAAESVTGIPVTAENAAPQAAAIQPGATAGSRLQNGGFRPSKSSPVIFRQFWLATN